MEKALLNNRDLKGFPRSQMGNDSDVPASRGLSKRWVYVVLLDLKMCK